MSSNGMFFSASCILTFLAYGLGVALIRRYMTTYFLTSGQAPLASGWNASSAAIVAWIS